MLASVHAVSLSADDEEQLAHTMRRLPPHDDVASGLTMLTDAGFRLVTRRIPVTAGKIRSTTPGSLITSSGSSPSTR
jgi:hypothetical protein